MAVRTTRVAVQTRGNGDTIDVTRQVATAVRESGLRAGIATVFVPGATAAVTTIEYEPGLLEDLKSYYERVIPPDLRYEHNLRAHDDNGHSHIRASTLGPSLTVPFVDGALTLGTWQQIVLVDFDDRPRSRQLVVQVMGE